MLPTKKKEKGHIPSPPFHSASRRHYCIITPAFENTNKEHVDAQLLLTCNPLGTPLQAQTSYDLPHLTQISFPNS